VDYHEYVIHILANLRLGVDGRDVGLIGWFGSPAFVVCMIL
jgi:hypothetical protein